MQLASNDYESAKRFSENLKSYAISYITQEIRKSYKLYPIFGVIKLTSVRGYSTQQIQFLIKRAEAPHTWCGR